MEDKTIVALVAMCILTIMLLIPVIILPAEDVEIKIGLATSAVAIIGSIVAYAYGIEHTKTTENRS